ncbi:hypothetical protein SIID45300_03251 [Candidatus Magnetaquicoccaceae bacterium FCR-1]|uniref:Prepilin-type N-terminal cleavage/methylation domain-containing protein n=1 Tax=Candidatus Magnetaquiglobus chichijimensis TaxID=3141448 RepID=A0ABQ0CDC5_9PROT
MQHFLKWIPRLIISVRIHHNNNYGFTLIEILIVIVILGILVNLASVSLREHAVSVAAEEAKPYLMAISAKEQIQLRRTRTLINSDNEQTLQDGLGVDLSLAGNFCFMVRLPADGLITTTTDTIQYEVWAVLRDTNYSGGQSAQDQVAVHALGGVTCTTATDKSTATGWVSADPNTIGGEGRVVVLRYPPPVNGLETAPRSGREIQLDWLNGISLSDTLL